MHHPDAEASAVQPPTDNACAEMGKSASETAPSQGVVSGTNRTTQTARETSVLPRPHAWRAPRIKPAATHPRQVVAIARALRTRPTPRQWASGLKGASAPSSPHASLSQCRSSSEKRGPLLEWPLCGPVRWMHFPSQRSGDACNSKGSVVSIRVSTGLVRAGSRGSVHSQQRKRSCALPVDGSFS